MAGELLSKFVNSFGAGLVSVSQTLGVTVSLVKTQVTQGVNAPGSRVAALVGLVGGGVHGTAALMVDAQGFASYVNAMSGGMIPPDLEDNVALSVVGELTNMVSGQTLMKLDIELLPRSSRGRTSRPYLHRSPVSFPSRFLSR
jgi:chemotaxis protein CheX